MIQDVERFNKQLMYWNRIEELCINEDFVILAMQMLSIATVFLPYFLKYGMVLWVYVL